MLPEGIGKSDRQAREQISSVCSTYHVVSATTKHEQVVRFDGPSDHLPAAPVLASTTDGNFIQCPSDWGGLLGVAVASQAGIMDPPDPDAAEPELDEQNLRRLVRWLVDSQGSLPDRLLRPPTDGAASGELRRGWDRTMEGLVEVRRGSFTDSSALVVIGESAEDFALARLWQLTYGRGIWLPKIFGIDENPLQSWFGTSLAGLVTECRRRACTVALTSITQSVDAINDALEQFREAVRPWLFSNVEDLEKILQSLHAEELKWPRSNTVHLGIGEQFDEILSMPTEINSTGTATMLAPLPPPLVNDPKLSAIDGLSWHADIEWVERHSIIGRRMTGREILVPSGGFPTTLIRSGRHGISYPSRRFDFVMAGIPAVNRMPRPKVRDLSLRDWVDAKLAQRDLTTRLSGAGNQTAQLERMLGGRQEFVDLFAGPLLPALRAMRATGRDTKSSYRNGEGVHIRANYGVLYFQGICDLVNDIDDEIEIRKRLDVAIRAGIVRCGLSLICAVCTERQFQAIDRLGKTWTCDRCDAINDLSMSAWKWPEREPLWTYDLHRVGRNLLEGNGDVPAALSAYLSTVGTAADNRYQDLAEIELISDAKSQVELDLVAYHANTLIVGEAKSAAELGRMNKEARVRDVQKKCLAAIWLEADELVFGTSEPSWKPRAVDDIRQAVSDFKWPATGRPVVRLIAGLDGSRKNSSSQEL